MSTLLEFVRSDLGIFMLVGGLVAALAALTVVALRLKSFRDKLPQTPFGSMDDSAAEREKQLQTAISSMGAAIWDWDVTSDLVFTGPRFARIFGVDPTTFNPTMTLHNQLCHPDDFLRVQQAFRDHVKEGAPYDVEYRLRHRAGHYVWVHSRGRIVSFDGDKPLRAIGTIIDITDRRKATEALHQSRESLKLAIEVAEAGYFDIDETTSKVSWSPQACAIFGVEATSFEPNRRTFAKFIHEDDLPEYLAEFEDFHARGTPINMDIRALHAQGYMIWINVRIAGQFNDHGRRIRTIGFIRDISKQRLAQQVIAESEVKYRSLVEHSIQGIVIHRKFKPLFCNRTYAKLLGYENVKQVLSLESIAIHEHGLSEELRDQRWEQFLSGKLDGVTVETEIVDSEGVRRWVETVGRVIDWEGEPAVQLICVDVTDRRKAERELRNSEARFRLVADNISDFVMLYDENFVYRYVSPSIQRVTGHRPEDLLGRSIFEHNLTLQELPESEREHIARTKTGQVLWQMRCRDGNIIWVESNNTIVPQPPGAMGTTVLSSSRDVSDRVARERELAGARDRLARQADELSVVAQNLEIAKEKAERASTAKSQFLAMMSHELRTPMTGVLGMADLLMTSNLNGEQKELTGTLIKSARSLLGVLNDILDFSKIESGQLKIESAPFSVSNVIDDVLNLFDPAASRKGVVLKSERSGDSQDALVGDAHRLRQVLSNLVGNAVKFTETGEIILRHSQESMPGAGIRLIVTVVDTGIGMTDEQSALVFQPFVQADISTSRKYGGSGLGLAICRRLVEAMGGSIDIQSELGEGTSVTFSIVVAAASETDTKLIEDAARNIPQMSKDKAPLGSAYSILVAEDNETNRFLISTMLKKMGHQADTVENGALALAAVQNNTYDIIIMDMQMPVMDGPEATRQIRKLSKPLSNTPIIALTADVIAAHRQSYLDAGVNAFIGKPVDWSALEREIARLMSPSDTVDGGVTSDSPESSGERQAHTDSHLDLTALEVLENSIGADLLEDMLVSFTRNMKKYEVDIGSALSEDDLETAKRTAHALKGLAAQFGAPRVRDLAKFIETEAVSTGEIAKVAPELGKLIDGTERALADRKEQLSKVH